MLRQRLSARRRAQVMGIVVVAAAAVSSVTTPASALPPPGGVAFEGSYAADGYINLVESNAVDPGGRPVSWTDPGGSVSAEGRFTDAADVTIPAPANMCGPFTLAPSGDGTTGYLNTTCMEAIKALQPPTGGFTIKWKVMWWDGVAFTPESQASIIVDTLAPASITIDDSGTTANKLSTPEALAGAPVSWQADDADNSVVVDVRNDPGAYGIGACTWGGLPAGPTAGAITPGCFSALVDGTVEARVSGVDVAGNPSVATDTSILDRVGSAAPAVSFGVPAVNSINQASVPITVTGALEPGQLIVQDAALNTVGPIALDLAANAGSETVNANLTTLNEGTLTATAVLTDVDGNPSAPGQGTIQKDVTPPPAPVITSPAPGQIVPGQPSVRIDGTGEIGASIMLFEGPTALLPDPVVVGSDGKWTAQVSYLTSGTKSVAAQATDTNGNIGPLSAPRIFDADVQRPGASITTPANDTLVLLSGGSVLVQGTATDDFGGLASVQYDLYSATGAVIQQGSMTCTPACTFSAPAPLSASFSKTLNLGLGLHTLHVHAVDRAGLRTSPPAIVRFLVIA